MELITRLRAPREHAVPQLRLLHACLLVIVAFVFVAIRPYYGIRHDGIVYVAQALYRLDPAIFSTDLFFKYGSQEAYSIFGRLYAFAIRAFGLGPATDRLLIASQLLFFAALVAWVRSALPGSLWLAGAFAVSLSSGIYGGEHFALHYAEPYLTARPFTEALSILALVALLRDRRWISVALVVAAAALHPIMALPALAVWWLLQVQQDRRWLAALVSVPAVFVLAAAGVRPFDGLLQFHDAAWREAIEQVNKDVFIFLWSKYDYMKLATDFVIVLWARAALEGRLRQLVNAILIVTAGCLLVSIVGADIASNVLVTGLQFWRAQWLLHFTAMSLLPLVVVGLWRSRAAAAQLAAMLLVYAALCRGLVTGLAALALAMALAFFRERVEIDRRYVNVAGLALVGGLFAVWHNNVAWALRSAEVLGGAAMDWQTVVGEYLRHPPLGPALIALALGAVALGFRSNPRVLAAVTAAAAVLAVASWDHRNSWARTLEQARPESHPFVQYVLPSEEVYWIDDALAPWLLLHRRSYVSGMQGAGLPFSRGTAMEMMRRSRVVGMFEFHEQVCGLMRKLNGTSESCQPDIDTMKLACEADASLSWIVTRYAIDNAWKASWAPPGEAAGAPSSFRLYSCSDLLKRKP